MTIPRLALLLLAALARVSTAQDLPTTGPAHPRAMAPADLFKVERIGAVSWSPSGGRALVELRRATHTIDASIPANQLRLLDTESGRFSTLVAPDSGHVGFFGTSWSPGGERAAFFSVDVGGSVRLWTWDGDGSAPRMVGALRVRHSSGDPARVHWLDDRQVLLVALTDSAPDAGPLYFRVTRSRNASDLGRRAAEGASTSTVMESGARDSLPAPVQLVRVDLASGVQVPVLTGSVNHLRLSPDLRTVAYFADAAPVTSLPVRSLVDATIPGELLYDAVSYGTVLHVVDMASGSNVVPPTDLINTHYATLRWLPDGALAIRSGIRDGDRSPRLLSTRSGRLAALSPEPADTARRSATSPAVQLPAPVPSARRLSVSPDAAAALWVHETAETGTHLILTRPEREPLTVWSGNAWVRELRLGRAERIPYEGRGGAPLNAWILYPAGHQSGHVVPVIVRVYPGTVYGTSEPQAFSLFNSDFEHPQLLAALGHAVLLPSVPVPDEPTVDDQRRGLLDGVLPLLDTVVARGIADPARIGVMGQSAGGFGTLVLISESDRFRTAIASASYSNFESLYGTFYGQYRYGDAGHPQAGQLLRMLQAERGYAALGASPLDSSDAYRRNSPLLRADRIATPLMLIHGEQDFIPVQQAEEMFTRLYRQDKRVRFVRYYGEFHTIAARANVLDMWERIESWLAETMP